MKRWVWVKTTQTQRTLHLPQTKRNLQQNAQPSLKPHPLFAPSQPGRRCLPLRRLHPVRHKPRSANRRKPDPGGDQYARNRSPNPAPASQPDTPGCPGCKNSSCSNQHCQPDTTPARASNPANAHQHPQADRPTANTHQHPAANHASPDNHTETYLASHDGHRRAPAPNLAAGPGLC